MFCNDGSFVFCPLFNDMKLNMKKLSLLFCVVCLPFMTLFSQGVSSPDHFLGYGLGTHFTPHFKIAGYFRQLAAEVPAMLKLQQYGETYEGRPLLMAIISSPENIQKLETIRLNNLRLAGVGADKTAPDETAPAIVWLSYNVHGNEPSSSEAAMKTAYELLNPANTQSKEWLKNTVVIIDPCVNPDGRDRYINWYNDVAASGPDPDPLAREHRETWPSGRTNHYNFDMNRDLAWQTQTEASHRMKAYNDWLPQVHVDYHEQGYNSPYYFAPAAQPYHEVITDWQRSFQVLIGKNNAKYFDNNGWLYFTKEVFDLFYPSYGDTYPLYNGAIGMTFEQGGISAGLAVKTEDGDTLTLKDRLEHHYTTGMSTIEVSSREAAQLVKEFHHFFVNAATNGIGDYKTYIIKSKTTSPYKMATLEHFLRINGIDFGFANASAPSKGYRYVTGKEEGFNVEANDLVISSYQPRSTMLKVLFEPQSKLVDSVTYDITAWALPYAIGFEAYAVKDKILPAVKTVAGTGVTKSDSAFKNAYAYLVPWTDLGSAKLLAQLLKAGIKVRFANDPFTADDHRYERGTLIITRAANRKFGDHLYQAISTARQKNSTILATIDPVNTGFVEKGYDFGSENVSVIVKTRMAMFTGEGVNASDAGEIWHLFEQQLHYPLTLINTSDLARIKWKDIDVLILPDGYYKFLSDKVESDAMRTWVQQGGKLIAQESAMAQMADADWGIKLKKDSAEKKNENNPDSYTWLKKYENRQRDMLVNAIPGTIYKVELDNTHPLAFGYPDYYFTLRSDDNIYEFLKKGGWNVGVIKKDNYISGFAGSKSKVKLKDGFLFGEQSMGRGSIIYLADDLMFRSFWESGKLMFANAVFLSGQ